MGYYKSPEEMFSSRADRFKRDGDLHWAMAKNGQGDYHYGKARFCYEQAAANRARAEHAYTTGATFCRSGSNG